MKIQYLLIRPNGRYSKLNLGRCVYLYMKTSPQPLCATCVSKSKLFINYSAVLVLFRRTDQTRSIFPSNKLHRTPMTFALYFRGANKSYMRDCSRLMKELYGEIRSRAAICNIFICVLGRKKEKPKSVIHTRCTEKWQQLEARQKLIVILKELFENQFELYDIHFFSDIFNCQVMNGDL